MLCGLSPPAPSPRIPCWKPGGTTISRPFAELRDDAAIAWADISTGAFHVMPIARVRVSPELARLAPSELLVPDGPCLDQLRPIADDHQIPLTPLAQIQL